MTESWLADEVAGLSPAQAAFRMTDGSWNVVDVVAHLAIAEPQYWDQLRKSVEKQPTGTRSEITDDRILWYGIDRTSRARTAEARTPKGEFTDAQKALAAVRKLRAAMLEYARTTQDDLRGRRLTDSSMDVYQWFLMISSHSQRHILQIREIKAHPNFPKK